MDRVIKVTLRLGKVKVLDRGGLVGQDDQWLAITTCASPADGPPVVPRPHAKPGGMRFRQRLSRRTQEHGCLPLPFMSLVRRSITGASTLRNVDRPDGSCL